MDAFYFELCLNSVLYWTNTDKNENIETGSNVTVTVM